MERERARAQLKGRLEDYVKQITEKSKGANMYVCPLCGSGTGNHGTGAFSIKDGVAWKCFSCNEGGDIFDLIGKVERIASHDEQLKRAGELFCVAIDGWTTYQSRAQTEQKPVDCIHTNTYTQTQGQQATVDYAAYFKQCHDRIAETDYPKKRGLCAATLERFNVGYDGRWVHPKAPNAPASPRLIIPISGGSYLARDTRDDIPEGQRHYSKSKVGAVHIFNIEALDAMLKPVFIVEGEIDALSIIEAGGNALALGSTSNVDALLRRLEGRALPQPLIVALDNDEAGEKASKRLCDGLKKQGHTFYRQDICGGLKDANEALLQDRALFEKAVIAAENIEQEADQARKDAYIFTSAAEKLLEFCDGITKSVNTVATSTGFRRLDKVLDGGLYEGLYIIGAISSLGKTTLVTQIADQVAQAGTNVLIFSLEMASYEIMAKSISRHTIEAVLATEGNVQDAKTARGITTGSRYSNYSDRERALIGAAIESYGAYASNIYINEGMGDIGIEQVRQTIKEHIYCTGKTPIVIIDYLQILAPYSERATDKQNTDKAVLELKRMSRDFKTPVIGISSFNRANYSASVTMEAFKESGAIEYSSDVLIGLQLKGAGKKDFDANEEKRKNPREIELVILKNRNGRTGEKIEYRYYPLFNYFAEV